MLSSPSPIGRSSPIEVQSASESHAAQNTARRVSGVTTSIIDEPRAARQRKSGSPLLMRPLSPNVAAGRSASRNTVEVTRTIAKCVLFAFVLGGSMVAALGCGGSGAPSGVPSPALGGGRLAKIKESGVLRWGGDIQ